MPSISRSASLKPWGELKEVAHPRRTYLDIDGPLPRDLITRTHDYARLWDMRVRWIRIDRTARGHHVIIEWNRTFTPAETVMLQLALGSDAMRENLNIMRVLAGAAEGNPYWNVLYRRKLK